MVRPAGANVSHGGLSTEGSHAEGSVVLGIIELLVCEKWFADYQRKKQAGSIASDLTWSER